MVCVTARCSPFRLAAPPRAGEPISGDLQSFSFVLELPNTYRFVAAFLTDPDRFRTYVNTRCSTEVIVAPQASAYSTYLTPDDYDQLDAERTQVQCVDNFGAFQKYELYATPAAGARWPSAVCQPRLAAGTCMLFVAFNLGHQQ